MTRDHLDVLRAEQRAVAVAAAQSTAADESRTTRVSADSSDAKDGGVEGTGMDFNRKRTTSMTNVKAMKRLAEQKDHLGHKSPLAVVKDVRPTRLSIVDAPRVAHATKWKTKKRSAGSSPSTATASDATATTRTSGKRSSSHSHTSDAPASPERVEQQEQDEGKEMIMMGVRPKKSWSQSLSGTFKLLTPVVPIAAPAPVSPSSSARGMGIVNGQEHSTETQAPNGHLSTTPTPALSSTRPLFVPPGGGQQQKLSKDSQFKTRLRENLSELERLEVNTIDLTPKVNSFAGLGGAGTARNGSSGAVVDLSLDPAGGINTSDANADTDTTQPLSIPVPPTTGGIEADDESSLSSETSESDGLSGVPEGEREYYPLAEKDKPLSARVLYPSDDEMGEFFHANADPHSAHPLHISPSTAPTDAPSSSSLLSPATTTAAAVSPGTDRGQLEVERVRKVERESGKLAGDNKMIVKPNKKVPIGTRLTMTSRAGFFQDRIISPSMVCVKLFWCLVYLTHDFHPFAL